MFNQVRSRNSTRRSRSSERRLEEHQKLVTGFSTVAAGVLGCFLNAAPLPVSIVSLAFIAEMMASNSFKTAQSVKHDTPFFPMSWKFRSAKCRRGRCVGGYLCCLFELSARRITRRENDLEVVRKELPLRPLTCAVAQTTRLLALWQQHADGEELALGNV